MTSFLSRVLLVFIALIAFSGPLRAEGRWALVLAVSDYTSPGIPSLDNTVNDGRTMAAALHQMGFEVYYLENATKAEFDAEIARLIAEQSESDVGFFFFAGHGLQVGGSNYALPADIAPSGPNFLQTDGISIASVVERLKETGAENLVVVLDACRNSPFPDVEASGTGLALIDAPENTIIAYSTAPGELALDGAGANSPYTTALATALEGPKQDIRDVLKLVRARVRLATGGSQTPWFVDNSKGEISIQPKGVGGVALDLPLLKYSEVSLERSAWWTIANSADPRDYRTFIRLFPDAPEADTAKRQLNLVEREGELEFPLMDLGLPLQSVEVVDGINSLITACDILATGLHSPMGLVEAVPHDLVNESAATRACIEAVRLDLDNPRLLQLLSRVMFLQERYAEALYFAEYAAELGSTAAYGGMATQYRLGLGVEMDLEKAAEMVRKGALLGSAPMRVLMGIYYREGWGVQQSYPEARRWFEVAERVGNKSAMSALGDLYYRGRLGIPDHARALQYYRRAAALDHTDAVTSVGMAYLNGEGVEQDYATAITYLSQASELGNPHAAFQLGRAFWRGFGVDKNPSQALAYFRLSAQRNNLIAYVLIGDVLKNTGDPIEAYANYVIAREGGLVRDTKSSRDVADIASDRLAGLIPDMSADQKASGERMASSWIEQYGLLDFNLVNE